MCGPLLLALLQPVLPTAESELSFCTESGFCWLLLQLFLSMSENTVFNAVLISFSRLDFETILDLQ